MTWGSRRGKRSPLFSCQPLSFGITPGNAVRPLRVHRAVRVQQLPFLRSTDVLIQPFPSESSLLGHPFSPASESKPRKVPFVSPAALCHPIPLPFLSHLPRLCEFSYRRINIQTSTPRDRIWKAWAGQRTVTFSFTFDSDVSINAGLSNPRPRTALNAAQHRLVNALKTLRKLCMN